MHAPKSRWPQPGWYWALAGRSRLSHAGPHPCAGVCTAPAASHRPCHAHIAATAADVPLGPQCVRAGGGKRPRHASAHALHATRRPPQVKPALAGSFFSGKQLQQRSLVAKAARPSIAVVSSAVAEEAERLRLNNLSPQDGARKIKNRKGRGYGAGQVGGAGEQWPGRHKPALLRILCCHAHSHG